MCFLGDVLTASYCAMKTKFSTYELFRDENKIFYINYFEFLEMSLMHLFCDRNKIFHISVTYMSIHVEWKI